MGSELRAQGNPCREKGVASEAALSSASRGTPVLSVPLLLPKMKLHRPEPVSGKSGSFSCLYVYETSSFLSTSYCFTFISLPE